MGWKEFTGCYFDELERRLARRIDRRAQLAAASAADLGFTVRLWVIFVALFATDQFDLEFGRFGWLFKPLMKIGRGVETLERFLIEPLARRRADAAAFYPTDPPN